VRVWPHAHTACTATGGSPAGALLCRRRLQVKHKDDGNIYAMKILKKEMVIRRKQYEHTLSERRILENIDHPFIVSLRYAFQTAGRLYMLFDFFNGGELYHYLARGGRFTEDRSRFYAAEIASALGYLHKRGIVYRYVAVGLPAAWALWCARGAASQSPRTPLAVHTLPSNGVSWALCPAMPWWGRPAGT
jgi:hypothetical protein